MDPAEACRFSASTPRDRGAVRTSRELVDLERDGFDVGLRSGDGVWPGLRSHKLLPFQLTPLCSSTFIKRFGCLKSAKDLLEVPLVERSDPYWAIWFAKSGLPNVDLGIKPDLKLQSRNLYAEAAQRGHGAALLSPVLYSDEIRAGRLIQPFPLVVDMSPRAYWFVYPVKRSKFTTVQAFRHWITKYAQGEWEAES
jgi:LysR family glycine cleavage system transcriptional activator